MEDLRKTRDDLLHQMDDLRRRLACLEVELFDGTLDLGAILNPSDRAEERELLGAKVEVSPGFTSIGANGVNGSPGGICFETDEPIRFRLRIATDDSQSGATTDREGELIWFHHDEGRPCRLGFKFVD